MKISDENKEIAKHIACVFKIISPPIRRFWDDNRQSDVFILQASDSPQEGVISYATVSLSDHIVVHHGKPLSTRVELVLVCGSAFSNMDKVLATLAFNIINSKSFCAPGVIFQNALKMYDLSAAMSDIYFTYPFIWDNDLRSIQLMERTVAWLLAIPIAQKETEFAEKYGSAELEKLFAEKSIDIYDLNRASVV